MPPSPDPMDLVLFASIVNAGGFSEAARKLGLPKSTLSRRIQELETRLGEKVLQRTTRRLVLTEMGLRILGSAEQIGHEMERVADVIERRRTRPSGRLRVSAPADLAAISLAPMFAAFTRDFPEVQLDLDMSPRYVDMIGESFDLAIRVGEAEAQQHLTTRHLIDLEIGLYAAPAYLATPVMSPDDLPHRDMLMLMSDGSPVPWVMNRGGEVLTIDAKSRRITANSYYVLRRLALLGAGISSLPEIFAADHRRSGALIRVLPDWTLRPASVRAVFPSRRLMPQKTRAFLDMLLVFLKQSHLHQAADTGEDVYASMPPVPPAQLP